MNLSSISSTRPVMEATKRQADDRRLWHTNAGRGANLLYVHLVGSKVPYGARPSGRVPSSIRQDQSAKNRRGPPGQSRLTSSTGSSQDVIYAVTTRARPPTRTCTERPRNKADSSMSCSAGRQGTTDMETNRAVASRSLGTPMALTILSASGFACHALVNQAHKSSAMLISFSEGKS